MGQRVKQGPGRGCNGGRGDLINVCYLYCYSTDGHVEVVGKVGFGTEWRPNLYTRKPGEKPALSWYGRAKEPTPRGRSWRYRHPPGFIAPNFDCQRLYSVLYKAPHPSQRFSPFSGRTLHPHLPPTVYITSVFSPNDRRFILLKRLTNDKYIALAPSKLRFPAFTWVTVTGTLCILLHPQTPG